MQIDEIELLVPCPWLEKVVYLEDAVWGDPGMRRWVQVYATDGC